MREFIRLRAFRRPLLLTGAIAGQEAAGQRTPGNHSDAAVNAEWDHLAFLLPVDQVVVVLHRHELRPSSAFGDVQHLGELPGEHARCADVERFA